jgi:glycosyltransferase involved in cell wall biosynthesis
VEKTMMTELNIWGSFSLTGYGVATINLAKALSNLEEQPLDLYLTPMGEHAHANSNEELKFIQRYIEKGRLCPKDTPLLKIWHQHSLTQRVGNGRYYAMPIFELNKFNDLEKHSLKFPDHLIVNSKWAKNVVELNLPLYHPDDTSVVPLGVDTTVFKPSEDPVRQEGTYNFLNMGKWEKRKGHDLLVHVFNKAFTQDDDVQLNLVPYNPFLKQQEVDAWSAKYKSSPLGDKIFILPRLGTCYDVANIMNQCDCGIFPSRGEGWNLELLEMLACGKPVITTNYSAHTEYCDEDNTYLVDIDTLEDAYDGKWFHGQGEWAHLGTNQIDQTIEYMRYCYKERPSNEAGIRTANQFTWEHSAKKLMEVIT